MNCWSLLLLRIGRFVGRSGSTSHGLARITLQSCVLASDTIAEAAVILAIEWTASLPVDLAVEVRHILLPESLKRLIGRRDQLTAIGRWVVDELPLVVLVLVIELANRRILAHAANPYDRSASESRTGQFVTGGRAPRLRRIRSIWSGR